MIFGEIPRKFHQNQWKNQRKLLENNDFSENSRKNSKKFYEILQRFSLSTGAKECQSCRSWKMLKNAYLESFWTQKSASIQKRTSPLKFDKFRWKIPSFTASYLSTKTKVAQGTLWKTETLERFGMLAGKPTQIAHVGASETIFNNAKRPRIENMITEKAFSESDIELLRGALTPMIAVDGSTSSEQIWRL